MATDKPTQSKRPTKPNRNMYLVFLAAWDQFQAFREVCRKQGVDPIRHFEGFDLEDLRKTTGDWVSSTRILHPSEIQNLLDYLAEQKVLSKRHSEGGILTFGGDGRSEEVGMGINLFRDFFVAPENKRWWPAFVAMGAMQDGIPRLPEDIATRCGLTVEKLKLGWRQLKRGFTVETSEETKTYKGVVKRGAGGKVRLPKHLIFSSSGDTNLDDVLEGSPGEKADPKPDLVRKPSYPPVTPLPPKVSSGPPTEDTIRQELKKIGQELEAVDREEEVPDKLKFHEIRFQLSRPQYDLLTKYLAEKRGGKSVKDLVQATFQKLLTEAEEFYRQDMVRKRLRELDRERQLLLAELSGKPKGWNGSTVKTWTESLEQAALDQA